ncbi:hypothetical protein [Micromonospora sp. WMMD980]|uniref:hypothetical protein n=1 Tax=Micromonospora sp. WMMD980 TaxID=3016088 RepID=UPI0024179EF9|nr:hypothetical protein [Micromonospora sp. WMMD980]MDG4802281.1 hypothetical protein [Micromonospora sp. WMMD980]
MARARWAVAGRMHGAAHRAGRASVMVGEEDAPARVPVAVAVGAMRWPIRVQRMECGEALSLGWLTALSELADAIGDHAPACRVRLP